MEGPDAGQALRRRLESGPVVVLDGATGTELERRGVPTGLPLWSTHALLDAPEVVSSIHADYVRAGAEVLIANTFRTQRRTLARAGRGGQLTQRDAELTALAVELARGAARSADRRVWVAGSAPPLEDCYRPDLVPDDAALRDEHARHANCVAESGVDFAMVETMNTLREAHAAAVAAREAGLEVVVSFVCWNGAQLLSGEPLAEACARIAALEPLAIGVNCLPPSNVSACLEVLADCGAPFGVYANLGEPEDERGFRRSEDTRPADFAEHASEWVAAGASYVGGCCGTGPGHVHTLAERCART